tara:strand:+ start:203 stop:850 length:648 start_codon:yes stop_codon:yes gene_type:complete
MSAMINFKLTQERLYRKLRDAKLSIDPKLANHPRACAELIETFVQEHLYKCIPNKIKFYTESTTAKALADVSCYDKDDFYYAFDVKTHNVDKWGMPNLVSYKKLDHFYQSPTNTFVLIIINYCVDDDGNIVPSPSLNIGPIESIPWKYLAVQGTLGQIQMINANRYGMSPVCNRPEWIEEFYNQVNIGIRKKIKLLEEELKRFSIARHWPIEYSA